MTEEFEGTHFIKYIHQNMKYDLKSDTFRGQIPLLKYQIIPKILIHFWRCKFEQVRLRGLLNYTKLCFTINLLMEKIQKEISLLTISSNCKENLGQMNDVIGTQIRSFLGDQNHFFYFTSLDKFIDYFDNICWTPQGTINRVKTAAKIIENTTLSTKEKYVLACKNCLEEKVRNLFKLLPMDFIYEDDEDDDEDYVEDNFQVLVKLWTRYVREGLEIWNIDEDWILSLKTHFWNKEVAVQYILEQYLLYHELSDVEIEFLICSINQNPNVYLYLLQEIPKIQKYVTNVETNIYLLRKLHNISKWSSAIVVAKYVHELIKFLDICDAFKIIIFCWQNNIINLEQYTSLWNELTLDFKHSFDKNFVKIFDGIYKKCFGLKKTDFVTVKFLMNKSTPKNIRKILYLKKARFFFENVIISEGPNTLDNIIYQALKTEKGVSEFKINYFNDQGLFIISKLIVYCKFDWIHEFIGKFCAEGERAKFERDFPYINNSSIIQFILHEAKGKNIDFLTTLNNFLNWHFKDHKEEICRCITDVLGLETDSFCEQRERFFEAVRNFIGEERWEFVEGYWKWLYVAATREQISSTKVKLTRMIKILILSSKSQCISRSMRYISHHELVKRLATLCFKTDELEDLKELGVRNHFQLLVLELLKKDRHQEVHHLIDWFFSSDETEINEFKIAFMLSPSGLNYLFNSIKNFIDFNIVIFLFKNWLNCPIDSAKLFQHRFVNFVNEKIETKYQTLDQNKKGGSKDLKNLGLLNINAQKCVDFLKVLLRKKFSLDKRGKGILDSKANQNSEKRVGENSLFQNQKRRKN